MEVGRDVRKYFYETAEKNFGHVVALFLAFLSLFKLFKYRPKVP